MKILIISNLFPPGFIGGYELGAYDIAKALYQKGHQINVLTSDHFLDPNNTITEFPVARILECTLPVKIKPYNEEETLGKGFFVNIRNIRLIGDVLKKNQPDAIVCFNLHGLGVLGILKYLTSLHYTPIVYFMDDLLCYIPFLTALYHKYLTTFGPLYFLHNTKNIFMSEGLVKEVEQSAGIKFKDYEIIPGWYKPENIRDIGFRAHQEGDKIRFIFVSRITACKGIDNLITAVKKITDTGHKNFIVDVYGAGEITSLMHKIAACSLREYIYYQGCPDKNTMCKIYAQYDGLIFPTWNREPFGFVVTEAAAAGCLPIMTNGIGAADWFIHDIDCIKTPNDTDDLAAALTRFLTMNSVEKNTMRQNAMHTAKTHLNFNYWLNHIETIITSTQIQPHNKPASPEILATAMLVLDDIWRRTTDGNL